MILRPYTPQDRLPLRIFFVALIGHHREYISHGELQMGVALAPGVLAPDYDEVWLRYLDRQLAESDNRLLIAEEQDGIIGFILFGITSDGAEPYGMIFDLGIDPRYRGRHIGSALTEEALRWFRTRGIDSCYLESGIDNHSAHRFFEHIGFEPVSHIFRLSL